jgi:hypothetical protein
MVSISDIDTALNSYRQSSLSFLSNVPGNTQLQSVFGVVALIMVVAIFMEVKKQPEERSYWAQAAVLLFCGMVMFGFKTIYVAYFAMAFLASGLVKKLTKGEWHGALIMLVPLYGVAFLVSINPVMLLGIVGGVTALTHMVRKRGHDKEYGTSDAAKVQRREGVPGSALHKMRKAIRWLGRNARKGAGWSRDKISSGLRRFSSALSEREKTNIEEQEHESAIAAAGKELAETMENMEKQQDEIEDRDANYIIEILRQCEELKRKLAALGDSAVDDERKKDIMAASKKILHISNQLVRDKLEEESLQEKAGKIFHRSMKIIRDAAYEATELEEKRSAFTRVRTAADQSIVAMEKVLQKSVEDLKRAESEASKSNAQNAPQRLQMMRQRHEALESVNKRLGDVKGYLDKILKRLVSINAMEDRKIQLLHHISKSEENHLDKMENFNTLFQHQDKQLRVEHAKSEKLFRQEAGEIPDAELSGLTDTTIVLFDKLRNIAELGHEYNSEELLPLIRDMAKAIGNVYHLARAATYMTMMYYRITQAMEELDKMAAIIDQNPHSKGNLAQLAQTSQINEEINKMAYKKGKVLASHIREAYRSLNEAYKHTTRHVQLLDNYVVKVGSAREEICVTLNAAFKKLLNIELAEAKKLQQGAAAAEWATKKARKAERYANAQVSAAPGR